MNPTFDPLTTNCLSSLIYLNLISLFISSPRNHAMEHPQFQLCVMMWKNLLESDSVINWHSPPTRGRIKPLKLRTYFASIQRYLVSDLRNTNNALTIYPGTGEGFWLKGVAGNQQDVIRLSKAKRVTCALKATSSGFTPRVNGKNRLWSVIIRGVMKNKPELIFLFAKYKMAIYLFDRISYFRNTFFPEFCQGLDPFSAERRKPLDSILTVEVPLSGFQRGNSYKVKCLGLHIYWLH